jgi:hypothetical protein
VSERQRKDARLSLSMSYYEEQQTFLGLPAFAAVYQPCLKAYDRFPRYELGRPLLLPPSYDEAVKDILQVKPGGNQGTTDREWCTLIAALGHCYCGPMPDHPRNGAYAGLDEVEGNLYVGLTTAVGDPEQRRAVLNLSTLCDLRDEVCQAAVDRTAGRRRRIYRKIYEALLHSIGRHPTDSLTRCIVHVLDGRTLDDATLDSGSDHEDGPPRRKRGNRAGKARATASSASTSSARQTDSRTTAGLCRNFANTGSCSYGSRCTFRHPGGGRKGDGAAQSAKPRSAPKTKAKDAPAPSAKKKKKEKPADSDDSSS